MTCSLMCPGRVWNWHRPQETRPPWAVPGVGMRLVSSRFTAALQRRKAAVVIHRAVVYLTWVVRIVSRTHASEKSLVECLFHSALHQFYSRSRTSAASVRIWKHCELENKYNMQHKSFLSSLWKISSSKSPLISQRAMRMKISIIVSNIRDVALGLASGWQVCASVGPSDV